MPEPTMDAERAAAFGGRMMSALNEASLMLMTSIGHQTGLFDTMASVGTTTCDNLAEAAGLNERYVREWLGAMTTGRVVEYDPSAKTYTLPPEHAASLTRAAGPGNLAGWTQMLPLLGEVEAGIVESFRKGGGVPYASYPRFQPLMAEFSGSAHDASLIDIGIPCVPGIVDKLKQGIDVADVGCGMGHAINLMAQAWPNSRFTGIDFSEEGIAGGRAEAARMGLRNAAFEVADAARLSGPPRFDFMTTFDAVHDQARPDLMLKGVFESLRPGGKYLVVDIAASSNVEENMEHPMATFLYTVSTMHCMTVSLAQQGGMGLGAVWGTQKAMEMFAAAGFRDIETKSVEADPLNAYYICNRP